MFSWFTDMTPATFETPEHGERPHKQSDADGVQLSEKNVENLLNGKAFICLVNW